jgi:hypothetical protein
LKRPTQIVSGGQTGVDRAALDAAIACGLPCGGWCPSDRRAEDGIIPEHYPLQAATKPGYRERTIRNVLDSDGTVLLYHGTLSAGTEETLRLCLQLRRPYRLIDAREVVAVRGAELVAEFVKQHGIESLNVAGPRADNWPGGYEYTFDLIQQMLSLS